MQIGRLYSFEAAHVVRDCSTRRCKYSIHGHSYKLEVVLGAKGLDKAGMIYDFGLMKREIGAIIDSFDHSTILFSGDDENYKNMIKEHSLRWVELPFNASCEQIARVIFALIDKVLKLTQMKNGEEGVFLDFVKLNETAKGWAVFNKDDLSLFPVSLDEIKLSDEITKTNGDILNKIITNSCFVNPKEI